MPRKKPEDLEAEDKTFENEALELYRSYIIDRDQARDQMKDLQEKLDKAQWRNICHM